jgi:hypothetical protein
MAEDMTKIKLVFKGLHVFHNNAGAKRFEAGVLGTEGHTFRISIISESNRERRRCTIVPKPKPLKLGEEWQLHIDSPATEGVRIYEGTSLDRMCQDFRWLMDLGGQEFHLTHAHQIDRSRLNPIITIPHGLFYSKLQTENLRRGRGGIHYVEFGKAAQLLGADIDITGGYVTLAVKGQAEEIFKLQKKDDVKYRVVFDNTPMPARRGGSGGTGMHDGHPTSSLPNATGAKLPTLDHFQFYYNFLHIDETLQYSFKTDEKDPDEIPESNEPQIPSLDPYPNPAFCPSVLYSKEPLIK